MWGGAVGKYLVVFSVIGVILIAGCISVIPLGDDRTDAGGYPRCPLDIVAPIHYLSGVDESDGMMTMLILNLKIVPHMMVSDEINVTQMAVTIADNCNLHFLDRGEYYITCWENSDGDDMLEPGEITEVTLPLQQPIPANTSVYIELCTAYHGTLILSFRTPVEIESSGQIAEFTVAPYAPY